MPKTLASAFVLPPEDYDPRVDDKPRPQHVPVKPKGELKPLDAEYYRDMPVMDKVSNLGRTFGQAIGASPTLAGRMGEDASNLVGFVPGVGDALGAVEAKEDLLGGNYGRAAIGAGLTAIGLIPGVGDVAAKAGREGMETVADTLAAAAKPSIKAFHGSPHSFDRFDMGKIGTGEGAQAYGHGLYFAENEGVAKSYRDTLASKAVWGDLSKNVDEMLPLMGANTPQLQEVMRPYITRDLDMMLNDLDFEGGGLETAKAIVARKGYQPQFQDAMAQKLVDLHKVSQGSMYEVNIDADPEHFLDWDKPLSEQAGIQAAMPDLGFKQAPFPYSGWMGEKLVGKDDYPETLLRALGEKGAGEQKLKQAGIPGIKYFDAGSRTPKTLFDGKPIQSNNYAAQAAADALDNYGSSEKAIEALSQHPGYRGTNVEAVELLKSGRVTKTVPEGSRNYVVFDDKLISIVKMYGIGGALGAGLITEEMARQMQEQGLGET